MTPAEAQLRSLIESAIHGGTTLGQIARDAGVRYHALWHWWTGRTASITVGTADALFRSLRKEGLQ
jgi:hypothetical protein